MTLSATATAVRKAHRGTLHTALPDVTTGSTPADPALPVDRTLVHRAHLRDVLPTRLTQHSDTRFSVSARWPREHALYLTPDGRYTASLVLETIRQATLLVSHAGLGVPQGHQFVMWELCHRLEPDWLPARSADPTSLTLEVEVTEVRRRASVPASATMEMVLKSEDRTVGSGSIRFNVTSPAAYTRIRGQVPTTSSLAPHAVLPTPVDPKAVHRGRTCDVVLTPEDAPDTWQLRADLSNELFFDRPNDHVPAMVLVEAAQQAAHLSTATGRFSPQASEMNFGRYVELGTPCRIEAHPGIADDGTARVEVTGHQDGQLAFTIRFEQSVAR
ncbi:ScbA/BarX family gamma-butyrolactone biosynthesis protein [Streptomyces sp. NPDC052051]|uniref:ScbA/BarX family gamma-butyrolactone biosynthesis protein n=1 Tax=Streptomyces sp. NPDC052051 TaxID=3154649 RepID=UPI0034222D6B